MAAASASSSLGLRQTIGLTSSVSCGLPRGQGAGLVKATVSMWARRSSAAPPS